MEKYGELSAEIIVAKLTAGAVRREHQVVVLVAGRAGRARRS
ncbi:hypothetical protein [Streptomyces venezuelae]|nr:hypothetical protein [Streptomyces venezuelae]